MVQQYNQNNINFPRGSQLFDADAELDLDNDMVVVTTADGPVTLTLPTATQIPGQEIAIKADDAGSTGNAVILVPLAGQNIDGAASLELTEDQESVCLKSDGSNWRVVCGGVGGGGLARAILPVYDVVGGLSTTSISYKVANAVGQTITIEGENLTGIILVDASTDVNVAGNVGGAPSVDSIVVVDTSIVVTLDCSACENDDEWGIILQDAGGNVYAAPSPIRVLAP